MMTCHDVAKYFLALMNEEAGDLISNMKLQKLVYYAQGFHQAIFEKPLFEADIEAWTHGPVIPELYDEYRKYDSLPLPKPDDMDYSVYDKDVRELLDEVYAVFGQFSAWKLMNMTHEESPWRDTPPSSVISCDSMNEYFKTQLCSE
ncbi:MAG: hypothetical protein DRI57_00895 [Deltaproteobacteria bacterium]|nr:MAG: hypothetical protein DRI57_00895 [Deltaproteobacteria bacterium]